MSRFFLFLLLLLFFIHSLYGQSDKNFQFLNNQHQLITPFELWNSHIYVKLKINDSDTLVFLFDNGAAASGIMIDSSIASNIGLKKTDKITGDMTGGKREFLITDSVSLTINKLFILKQKAAWFQLKDQEKEEGHQIDGILGYSFFKYFVFEIDYRENRLTIADPKYYNEKRWLHKIPLIDLDKNRVPIVGGILITRKGKKIRTTFTFDTGHDEYIVLGKEFLVYNNLEDDTLKIQPTQVSTAGLGGETIHKSGIINGFTVGSVTIQKPNTIFAFDKDGFYSSFDGALLVGRFFRNYKLILNYPKKYSVLVKP